MQGTEAVENSVEESPAFFLISKVFSKKLKSTFFKTFLFPKRRLHRGKVRLLSSVSCVLYLSFREILSDFDAKMNGTVGVICLLDDKEILARTTLCSAPP